MMIVAALPASQRHFSSPSAARRGRRALRSQDPHVPSKRRARARSARPRDRTRLPSSIPPPRLRATRHRGDKPEPSAIPKSP